MKTYNEIIAEFMDGTVFDESGQCTDPERKYSWRPGVYDPLRVEHLQYHANWSWLMPVVMKCAKIIKKKNYPWELGFGIAPVEALMNLSVHTPIKKVYSKVVQFIKWYNSQKDKSTL